MIIGDAGYGVIFLLVSVFAHRKSVKKGQPLTLTIKLLYVLSMSTIAWGTITGNWFGAVQIAGLPFFKALTIPQIATFPELFPGMDINPQREVMFICFVIAVIHLGLANIMNFVNELPQLKSIAHLGWFAVIVGLFFLVLNLVLGMAMPGFATPLIISGLAAVILFINQEKGTGILKGIAKGVGGAFTTFLDAVSSFSNIISYIRLFAVGMATVAIASSFNQIAAPLMHGYTFPAAALILLIGHGLNIVMGLLSVVVHGIRLNMLEFSGQLGMEWTGYEYEPFQEKTKD
jgi:V/A-type H+-transporting ATPase subunit I